MMNKTNQYIIILSINTNKMRGSRAQQQEEESQELAISMESVGGKTTLELLKVNLSGIALSKQGDKNWEDCKSEVSFALRTYGCFEVIYDQVRPELRADLFEQAMPTIFQEEAKLLNSLKFNYDGAWIQRSTDLPLKCLRVPDPVSLSSVHNCSKAIWPQGNDSISNTVWKYSTQMQALMKIIHRMIFESLGLEDLYEAHMKSVAYSMKLSEYYDSSANSGKGGIPSHVDPSFVSIVSQHKVGGLEVETPDGEWVRFEAKPNCFVVMLGEVFKAWTNGVFQAPTHRVTMDSNEKRYSVTFNTLPSYMDDKIQAPNKLVDVEHPQLFKPFKYYDYMKFCHSEEGAKHQDLLKAYCGV